MTKPTKKSAKRQARTPYTTRGSSWESRDTIKARRARSIPHLNRPGTVLPFPAVIPEGYDTHAHWFREMEHLWRESGDAAIILYGLRIVEGLGRCPAWLAREARRLVFEGLGGERWQRNRTKLLGHVLRYLAVEEAREAYALPFHGGNTSAPNAGDYAADLLEGAPAKVFAGAAAMIKSHGEIAKLVKAGSLVLTPPDWTWITQNGPSEDRQVDVCKRWWGKGTPPKSRRKPA